jgi:hypothetical protein
MALKLLQPGTQPLGQFDGLDTDYLTVKGGEICTLIQVADSGQPGVTSSAFDKAAYDVFDGYDSLPGGVLMRPALTHTFTTGTSAGLTATPTSRPLMLTDDGIAGYGTLFGSVVGGVCGQQVNSPSVITGALLGPHTATGSGKITAWDKPGLYAVSLDATDTAAVTGLQPSNSGLFVGCPLGFTVNGVLTPNLTGNTSALVGGFGSGATNCPVVGRFIEFNTNGSLVNTPNYLVAALNSPSGNVSSVGPHSSTFVTVWFSGPL